MIDTFLLSFIPLFVAFDVLGVLPLYLRFTASMDSARRTRHLRDSLFTAFTISLIFVIVGNRVMTYLGISMQGPVGQGHEPVAQVAHGRHVEIAAQHGRTAAGIKRRDQMHGIVGVSDQGLARFLQRRAAGEKQDSRPQVRAALRPGHAHRIRDIDLPGDPYRRHALSSRRRQPAAAWSKSTPPLISKTLHPRSALA